MPTQRSSCAPILVQIQITMQAQLSAAMEVRSRLNCSARCLPPHAVLLAWGEWPHPSHSACSKRCPFFAIFPQAQRKLQLQLESNSCHIEKLLRSDGAVLGPAPGSTLRQAGGQQQQEEPLAPAHRPAPPAAAAVAGGTGAALLPAPPAELSPLAELQHQDSWELELRQVVEELDVPAAQPALAPAAAHASAEPCRALGGIAASSPTKSLQRFQHGPAPPPPSAAAGGAAAADREEREAGVLDTIPSWLRNGGLLDSTVCSLLPGSGSAGKCVAALLPPCQGHARVHRVRVCVVRAWHDATYCTLLIAFSPCKLMQSWICWARLCEATCQLHPANNNNPANTPSNNGCLTPQTCDPFCAATHSQLTLGTLPLISSHAACPPSKHGADGCLK